MGTIGWVSGMGQFYDKDSWHCAFYCKTFLLKRTLYFWTLCIVGPLSVGSASVDSINHRPRVFLQNCVCIECLQTFSPLSFPEQGSIAAMDAAFPWHWVLRVVQRPVKNTGGRARFHVNTTLSHMRAEHLGPADTSATALGDRWPSRLPRGSRVLPLCAPGLRPHISSPKAVTPACPSRGLAAAPSPGGAPSPACLLPSPLSGSFLRAGILRIVWTGLSSRCGGPCCSLKASPWGPLASTVSLPALWRDAPRPRALPTNPACPLPTVASAPRPHSVCTVPGLPWPESLSPSWLSIWSLSVTCLHHTCRFLASVLASSVPEFPWGLAGRL
ncbi:uncharacterized protein LOC110350141 [Heterocephalus glaber]|uniref:Uncharacterized protein LOC110350141 n=1 Tax=Heterocephalus glaber TaxID=10181 RepID=A0AAX6T6E1_HETGA|nr:uncharacterized protein LOC110350141 [Heterocephalus glaber]